MSEAEALVQRLVAFQNKDGGWPYQSKGASWTEPTAFAVLALGNASASDNTSLNRGLIWLLSQQTASGGWVPRPGIRECTSVTSVAALALLTAARSQTEALISATDWLLKRIYTDGLSLSSVLARIMDLPPPHAPGSVPWYPGTAGWVTPTALTSIALIRAAHQLRRDDLYGNAGQCCSYLLSRRCGDHGWNHGGSKVRSENATSYPETTGLALLALRVAGIDQPSSALTLAKRFACDPGSVEALSWLQLGIGSPTAAVANPLNPPRIHTIRDLALRLLAVSAANGKNAFLPSGSS